MRAFDSNQQWTPTVRFEDLLGSIPISRSCRVAGRPSRPCQQRAPALSRSDICQRLTFPEPCAPMSTAASRCLSRCLRPSGLGPLIAATVLAVSLPAWAVPPPPDREDLVLDLQGNGPEQVVRDTVRAYQSVPVSFHAQTGDRLLLRLVDGEQVLVLGMEGPSGWVWLSGAKPGPDGLELRLGETGQQRLRVLMSADAARSGRAASFELGLRLRR